MNRTHPARLVAAVVAPFVVVLSGCRQEEPSVYSVPKQPAAAAAASADSPHGAGGMASGHGGMGATPQVAYATPPGWTEQGAAGMNLASFTASGDGGGVEVAVLALPVAAGKEVGINILRERVGLPGLDAAGLAALAEPVKMASGEGQLYDMATDPAAEKPARMLLGVLTDGPLIWYARMTGVPAAVEAQKPAFLGLLESLKFGAPGVAAASSAPAIAAAAGPSSSAGLPTWEVPSEWRSQPAPNMVLAKFTAGPAGQEAEIAISAFPGDVGGAAANVNRWRAQLGLPPVADAEALALLSPVVLADGDGQLVEIAGQRGGQDVLLIGAIVPRGGQTWFYKMTGPPDTARAEREAFAKFLKSARHPQP